MPDTLQPDRLLRDELLVFQRRALRDWKASAWLAEHRPRESLALDTQPGDEVWLDLSGSGSLNAIQPGAIAIGTERPVPESPPSGDERRANDIPWDLSRGIPAEARTVDRLYVDADSAPVRLVDEASRVSVPGGSIQLRGRPEAVARLRRQLEAAGWTAETATDALGHARIHQSQVVLRLTRGATPLADVGPPNVREVVLGETVPERRRLPR